MMMVASSDLGKSQVMLNRKIVWQDEGFAYKPDTRHCERVVEALNVQHSTTVVTPAVRDIENVDCESIRVCSWEPLRAPDSQGKKASMRDELDARQDTSVQERSVEAKLLGRGQARRKERCESVLQVHCDAHESAIGKDSSVWSGT